MKMGIPLKTAMGMTLNERIAYEPLADYHVDGYVEAYTNLLASNGLRILTHPAVRSRLTRLIRQSVLRRFLRGQSIYACYLRT